MCFPRLRVRMSVGVCVILFVFDGIYRYDLSSLFDVFNEDDV